MFINFCIARPTYCLTFVYSCGLTVDIKRIFYVTEVTATQDKKVAKGPCDAASVSAVVQPVLRALYCR